MKNLIAVTFVLLSLSLSAQKLKEKMNDKLNTMSDKVNGAPEATASTAALSANQYEMIEPFTKMAKVWCTELSNGVSSGPFVLDATYAIKNFVRDESGKVVSFNSNVVPDFQEYPRFWVNSWKDRQVFFIQNYCFIIKIDQAMIQTPEQVETMVGWDGVFERILCLNKEDAKSITLVEIKELIKNYLTETQKGVSEINAKKEAEKLALRAEYSIKGKKVKSLAIESSQEFIRYNENTPYIIVATLVDGTVIKAGGTENGFLDDYKITVTGMQGGEAGSLVNNFYATPTDKITLTVTSAYDAAITASKVFKMKYEVAPTYTGEGEFKFSSQGSEPPYRGIDSRIEIKQVKNANSGEVLLEYRIFDMNGTKPNYVFKCKPETPVQMAVHGRRITTEANGVGKNGADGGNIKVVVDPSVTATYNLTTIVNGAQGQEGSAGDGNPGKDGTVTTVKQKVSF